MKSGWKVLRVADFSECCLGKMLDKKKNKGTPRKYLRNLNVRWFDFDLDDLAEMKFEDAELERYSVKKGDLVVCEGGYPGRGAIWPYDEPVQFQKALHRVRCENPITAKWLLFFLNLKVSDGSLAEHFTGSGIQHLTGAALSNLKVPLPPLEEQKRIVAVLDEAFEGVARARANAEANLADARELIENETDRLVFGSGDEWIATTLDHVCDRFEYGTSAKSKPSGRVPVLRMGNLQAGEIDWGNLVYTDDVSDIQTLNLKPCDVLFNRTNSLEHVGKAAIYRGCRKAIFAGYLIRLHYNAERINPEFLNAFLNSRRTRAYGRTLSGKSVNQANISAGKLRTYPISLPPLLKQKEIVMKLAELKEGVKQLEGAYSEDLSNLDNLRQSLLQKAFSGELT